MGIGDAFDAITSFPSTINNMVFYGGIAVIGTIVFIGVAIGVSEIRSPGMIGTVAVSAAEVGVKAATPVP